MLTWIDVTQDYPFLESYPRFLKLELSGRINIFPEDPKDFGSSFVLEFPSEGTTYTVPLTCMKEHVIFFFTMDEIKGLAATIIDMQAFIYDGGTWKKSNDARKLLESIKTLSGLK
ncbi:MAG: hypothetical protein D6698_17375 [Gammaproteobacteria bacterium]|nr:MAG: hypothetical protein D6698_17375 [Gammaproteobacteria bacterium]